MSILREIFPAKRPGWWGSVEYIPLSLLRLGLKFYQLIISPVLGPRCRFYPSCSHYTLEALSLHGLFKGGFLSIKRIISCHPGNPGGIDPVPDSPLAKQIAEEEQACNCANNTCQRTSKN